MELDLGREDRAEDVRFDIGEQDDPLTTRVDLSELEPLPGELD